MFVMPDIPFAVLVLLVLGYIIYRIVRKIKEYIERVKWELDDSPEALRIKARDKEICRVVELALSNQITLEELKKEMDRIDNLHSRINT